MKPTLTLVLLLALTLCACICEDTEGDTECEERATHIERCLAT